jgi:hypothetical protein
MYGIMETMVQTNEQVRLSLLEKCYNLGLPASSRDDINTLKMYLDVDSKLDEETFNFQIETVLKKDKNVGLKSLVLKLFTL